MITTLLQFTILEIYEDWIKEFKDWFVVLGLPTSLESGCCPGLSDLSPCDACVDADFWVQIQFDGNIPLNKILLLLYILKVARTINSFSPTSDGVLTNIFGLPLSLQKVPDDTCKVVVVSEPIEHCFAI